MKSHNRTVFYLIVTMSLVIIMAARAPLDTDMWWHIRSGEETWKTGTPITQDQFSFTRTGEEWINHSWLSQVGLYLIFNHWGYSGLTWLVAITAMISMGFLFLQMEGHPLLRAFIIVFASVVAAPVWSPRPQITSLVMLAVLGFLIYQFKWKKRNHLWILFPLFVLWSNLHGGYILGFVFIGTIIAGEILNHFIGNQSNDLLQPKHIIDLSKWLFLSIGGVLINPNGIKTWLIPFQTVGVKTLQQFISEWASPDFHQTPQQALLWMLFTVIVVISLSGKRVDGSDLIPLIFFSYLAFIARRNFGPFAVVASPILSRYLYQTITNPELLIIPKFGRLRMGQVLNDGNYSDTFVAQKSRNFLNIAVIIIFLIMASLKVSWVSSPELVKPSEANFLPVNAVNWIRINHPSGPLFNSYSWGGYLLWSLRDYPVFVDGRTDLYHDDILTQWIKVVRAERDWQSILNEWNIRLILLEPDWPVIPLLDEYGWTCLYQDDISVIYGR
jgi:hypothetical protein